MNAPEQPAETPASEIQDVTPAPQEAQAPPPPPPPPAPEAGTPPPPSPTAETAQPVTGAAAGSVSEGPTVVAPAPSQPPVPQAAPEPAGQVAQPAVAGQAAPPPAPPTPAGPLPPAPLPQVVESPAGQPRVMNTEWPFIGYNGPQPWEADNPPMLTQNHLMLSAGMSGPEVVELAALLAYLGYGTSISAGQNPHAIYDTGVSAAVAAFCRDYGVEEDPRVRNARTDDTVGPWLWEALTRAVHKKVNEHPSE